MGLFRKTLSVSSFGLIDFRSDKERTARYTRQMRDEQRRQTAMLRGGQHQQATATTAAPGWYPDPYGQSSQRYWDGANWTAQAH